ncbi:MAG: 3-deoxy-8-phosphooctulonate synthase [bacterium]|nr:3-deoxy-8-phosphooctulonate synthase [Candidatus Sumerlaeota bacterium]
MIPETFRTQVCEVRIGNVRIGAGAPLALIAGPCVIESREHCLMMAHEIARIASAAGIPFIFKASFDKANRSSLASCRGPGMERGLEILAEARAVTGAPILTDIHAESQVAPAAVVADCIQLPAFLCRQTDLLLAAGRSGKPVNVKKGQFMAPWDMKNVCDKITSTGNRQILLTERGASFGYNNLVSDMRSLPVMREFGYPVVFDATHSVQLPGGLGAASGGQRQFIFPLARAAVAAGIDALFIETHNDPENAMSDGPNALPLDLLPRLIRQVIEIDRFIKSE